MIDTNSNDNLSVNTTDGKKIILDPSCLLVFVDETGDMSFSDKKFPIFGLGGCATLASSYMKIIANPWNDMKEKYFEGSNKHLHASELRDPTIEQIEAITSFFKKNLFSRFAALLNVETKINVTMDNYHLAARALLERIKDIAQWYKLDEIALIVEQSKKGNRLAERYFPKYEFKKNGNTKIPITYLFISKETNEPGLEVSDFIIHTAGCQVRRRIQTENIEFRKDFKAIFQEVNDYLVSYIKIDKAKENRG
jgi:hypothetical protein